MDSPAKARPMHVDVWSRYRDNLPRHLIGISRQLQSEVMQVLTQDRGHPNLKLSFEPYIAMVGATGCRLSELADWLCVSKQACNQTANQIERAGYVERQPDPLDGRARMLVLTKRGHELVRHGTQVVQGIEERYAQLLGPEQYTAMSQQLGTLYEGMQISRRRPLAGVSVMPHLLIGRLARMSDYLMQRLMVLTMEHDHPGLKMSHGQVLTLIGPEGGRIQQMAAIHQVSKQAISVVAKDLEQLGYLQRRPDPTDGRGVVLTLTAAGEQLLIDSIASVDAVEQEFTRLMGSRELGKLERNAQQLYRALHLEEDVFEIDDLPALAHKLKQRLGVPGALQLAQLLNNKDEVFT